MGWALILTAAGRGTRAGGGQPKQFRPLAGRPMIAHALAPFQQIDGLAGVCITLEDPASPEAEALRAAGHNVVAGGASRAASVRAGLEALEELSPEHVLIHDAARPCASPALVARVLGALQTAEAAAPALPVTDALWRGDSTVEASHPRDGLWRAQTPQGFRFAAILAAHRAHEGEAADDVAVARAAGIEVAIVPGEEDNLKVTHPEDFARAERLLAPALNSAAPQVRVGNGYDVHRFGTGDHVWLCGIKVPHDRMLQGHSDADVGMHALTDAIYGALSAGDIGQHFPPSDPQWKGAESHIFLAHAAELARAQGWRLSHADVTLVCERPKIGPHAEAMRVRLAEIAGVAAEAISVKATTSERLGFTGREEGIAALATATLVRP
ncbi:bifunctional 2-C-methyl-D-erythritol 4-phosphate cytidylyltransferase/2-C-methyl-D-erythritol 2,4-cyclodiphosphate synthase [Pseudoroseicyclus tamaricis]|uniref:Bifunctional enzyme IspD/IspF n=1 Tax=Pseudoroseicyclus tamaricis TaxID=2705421 RepID=A0A6B2JIT1_9RHOB|nr:bifunctional 2-C-methyl-D-erythritol 4-phosphate cytidylyltransferase/2-C-methyl-D-erythritol 2,4-cyclodiphosphate synthase [Pseudoroseicyclus tamaricis]NDV01311.1 bifunctional 2-C-methyl-D-erythritol 4-phosphate cytidylyltransferase/2-C-methyl-D-erythritol 2,4-cyclodiphosphate synthase [Pseudoroseicyclus tamaricis]